MNFGYINGADGGRTGVTLSEPSVGAVKILDTATYAERAKALRELADMYVPEVKLFPRPLPKYVEVETTDFDRVRLSLHGKSVLLTGNPERDFDLLAEYMPHPTHTLDAEPGPEPSVRRPLAAAEWQCVASALGLAVAMLESNSPEVIRAAQALAVSKVHELRS